MRISRQGRSPNNGILRSRDIRKMHRYFLIYLEVIFSRNKLQTIDQLVGNNRNDEETNCEITLNYVKQCYLHKML